MGTHQLWLNRSHDRHSTVERPGLPGGRRHDSANLFNVMKAEGAGHSKGFTRNRGVHRRQQLVHQLHRSARTRATHDLDIRTNSVKHRHTLRHRCCITTGHHCQVASLGPVASVTRERGVPVGFWSDNEQRSVRTSLESQKLGHPQTHNPLFPQPFAAQ